MKRVLLAMAAVFLIGGCTGADTEEAVVPGDTLTRAQRDSVIGASALPGARSVQRAIDTRDTANARNSAMDSLLKQ